MSYKSRIVFLLDCSGSMALIKDETIKGVNKFISEQKMDNGRDEIKFSLVQFSDDCAPIILYDLYDVPPLTSDSFAVGGCTALYDAMAKTIDLLGIELASLEEIRRPKSVIMVILTDGEENSSVTYTQEDVFNRVNHQQSKYSWKFIYLGANQDAIQSAKQIGIGMHSSIDYDYTGAGVSAVMRSCAKMVSSVTHEKEYGFTDDDRFICLQK